MQKITLTLLVLFIGVKSTCYSQDIENNSLSTSKFQFHSISFSPLDFYLDSHTEGLSVKLDIALNKERNIFKFQGAYAYVFDFISQGGSSYPERFFEFNILYGREISFNRWLFYDVFGGVGYLHVSNFNNINKNNSTIGFPIQNRLRFQTKGKFGTGLQFQVTINSLRTNYSPGFFLQWSF